MKIKSVRARVYEWKGKTVPPQGNFCSNAMDLLYSRKETMSTFRFHSWTVVEVETDDGIVGLGNVALAPKIAKADGAAGSRGAAGHGPRLDPIVLRWGR